MGAISEGRHKVIGMIGGGGDSNRKTIAVHSTLSANTVRSRITVSRDLEKYFKHLTFFSCYDAEIGPNSSILNIPALSIVLPLAWITGADVQVDELDRVFAQSMDDVQREYRRMYPGAPFKTRLIADRLVENGYPSKNSAILFSGGLDATYSLFSNMALRPRLIMILGTFEIPISNVALQKTLEREYSGFAEREGLVISFVRTNALEILDLDRVNHLFASLSRFPCYGSDHSGSWPIYWTGIGYSLGHIGQTAPLSIGRFNDLIVAAAFDERIADEVSRCPDACYPTERIAWANIHVREDGKIPRHQKALALRGFLNGRRLKLRVCNFDLEPARSSRLSVGLNCNVCLKCLMTIAELALAGIDPNECGFSVDELTFSRIRALFQRRFMSHDEIELWWKPIQHAIPSEIEGCRSYAREFFDSFRKINLDSSGRPKDSLLNLYYRLPYRIASLLRIICEKTPVERLPPIYRLLENSFRLPFEPPKQNLDEDKAKRA